MRFSRLRSIDMSAVSDERARDALERYRGLVIHLVKRIHIREASVTREDLLQIASIEIVQSLTNHDPAASSEASWIARHVWHALCRVARDLRFTHGDSVPMEGVRDTTPGPDELRDLARLRARVAALPERERISVTVEDAHKALGVSRQRAHQLRQRVVDKLREAA